MLAKVESQRLPLSPLLRENNYPVTGAGAPVAGGVLPNSNPTKTVQVGQAGNQINGGNSIL